MKANADESIGRDGPANNPDGNVVANAGVVVTQTPQARHLLRAASDPRRRRPRCGLRRERRAGQLGLPRRDVGDDEVGAMAPNRRAR